MTYIPSDNWAAYRFGIKQATEPVQGDLAGEPAGDFVNAFLQQRRKHLLTKKVTKWACVVSRSRRDGDGLPPAYSVYGDLHEGKTSAQQTIVSVGGPHDEVRTHIVGVFPVEIEVPI
jgi:hypothetical protein